MVFFTIPTYLGYEIISQIFLFSSTIIRKRAIFQAFLPSLAYSPKAPACNTEAFLLKKMGDINKEVAHTLQAAKKIYKKNKGGSSGYGRRDSYASYPTTALVGGVPKFPVGGLDAAQPPRRRAPQLAPLLIQCRDSSFMQLSAAVCSCLQLSEAVCSSLQLSAAVCSCPKILCCHFFVTIVPLSPL